MQKGSGGSAGDLDAWGMISSPVLKKNKINFREMLNVNMEF